ncbi:hypothetical protein PAXRUDRAFT_36292 [Paxillus rubicundulus Ve08.2h10]|uniref:Uncharacterized protein n=1 Tax=Paxillus rubicundulus Ve08.2h10 TaxID=930991 RepID=A0A0D0CP09_9AGAM|nr:hypothetical protein PAXRUDRAFT_36848 [Paxillus rubicundulus Ve08.2h10]KIK80053.1 hypothetical protein PAXRUDRAFT_36292 [Paxillus rubicundulus Ve08.2h10]
MWSLSPVVNYNILQDKIFNGYASDNSSEPDYHSSETGGHCHKMAHISQLNPAPGPAEIIGELIMLDGTGRTGDYEEYMQFVQTDPTPEAMVELDNMGEYHGMETSADNSEDLGGILEFDDVEIRFNAKGQQEGFCMDCKEWISLGQSKRSLYAYHKHVGSRVCSKAVERKRVEAIRGDKAQLLMVIQA